MAIEIKLSDAEAIFTTSALEEAVQEIRKFLVETDAKYGKMNDIYRNSLAHRKNAHKILVSALRERGYSMQDIEDKEGDTKIGGNLFEPKELDG